MDSFECSKCGACCRSVRCSRLVGGLCSVYESRPLVCDVTRFWEKNLADRIPFQEWADLNHASCEALRRHLD